MTLKDDAIFKEKLTRGLKNNIRNLAKFYASSWKSKHLHFNGLTLSKANKVLDKKVQKSYVSWQWRVTQSDSWFHKWHQQFDEFQCEQWQVWKFALCCSTFVESILYLSQKSGEELRAITLKNDAKFEEELTCALKNDMGNLVNFTGTLKNLEICTLRDFFVQGI